MAHSNSWSTTTPTNDEFAGKGAEELRNTKTDIKERLTLDHYMDGELDDTKATAEGKHRKVTFAVQTSDPASITDTIIVYAKSDGLYYRTPSGINKLL